MACIPPRRISGQTGGVLCTLRNRLGVEPLVPRTLQVHTLYSLRPFGEITSLLTPFGAFLDESPERQRGTRRVSREEPRSLYAVKLT